MRTGHATRTTGNGHATTTTGYAHAAVPPTTAPAEFTSAWTDLQALEQRIADAHVLLTELEQRLGSVLAPVGPADDVSVGKAVATHSPLVEAARTQFSAVDLLVIRLTRIRDRVEL